MAQYANFMELAESMNGGAVVLSGSTIALLLSALGESLENYGYWQGSGDFSRLTVGEWDEIQGIVALAEKELMKSGLTGTFSDVVKVPNGALLCDGTVYNRVDYPDLYECWIGTTLIIDADTFRVPDVRGLFRVGASSAHAVLSSGGEENHTLTLDEIPSHYHGESVSVPAIINGGLEAPATSSTSSAGNTGVTGGGQPHNNMPPFIAFLVVVWT